MGYIGKKEIEETRKRKLVVRVIVNSHPVKEKLKNNKAPCVL